MFVLIVYDVQSSTSKGRDRLRRVAKICESVGARVQNSVFECLLDAKQYRELENSLLSIIDAQADRLRFYNLGNHYQNRITEYGPSTPRTSEEPIIL